MKTQEKTEHITVNTFTLWELTFLSVCSTLYAQYLLQNLKILIGLLTYETLRFTASFPELSSSGLKRRNRRTLLAKSISPFQGIFFMVVPNSNPAGQKRASYHQNPKFSGQNWLLDNCLSSNHLLLDILTPATSCPLLHSSDSSPVIPRSKGPDRGEDAARSSAAAQQRREMRTSICPWARAGGREDAAGPEGITAPIAAPCHTQIWRSHCGNFPIPHSGMRFVRNDKKSCLSCCDTFRVNM